MPGIVRAPHQGKVVETMGNRLTTLIASAETAGARSMVDFEVAKGFVAPPIKHSHPDLDWQGVVTEGEVAIELDGVVHTVVTGGVVWVPRGTVFRWWNPSADRPARWLLTYTPGGFEGYFAEIADAVAALGRAPTPQDLGAIARPLWKKYGLDVHG